MTFLTLVCSSSDPDDRPLTGAQLLDRLVEQDRQERRRLRAERKKPHYRAADARRDVKLLLTILSRPRVSAALTTLEHGVVREIRSRVP